MATTKPELCMQLKAALHLFTACAAAGIGQGMDAAAVAQSIFHPSHTVDAQLFALQTLDVVRVIKGKG